MGLEKDIKEIKQFNKEVAEFLPKILTLSTANNELPVKTSVIAKEMGFKSTRTIHQLIKEGKIPHRKLGATVLVFRSEILAAIDVYDATEKTKECFVITQ